jgi:hypothetical protein
VRVCAAEGCIGTLLSLEACTDTQETKGAELRPEEEESRGPLSGVFQNFKTLVLSLSAHSTLMTTDMTTMHFTGVGWDYPGGFI